MLPWPGNAPVSLLHSYLHSGGERLLPFTDAPDGTTEWAPIRGMTGLVEIGRPCSITRSIHGSPPLAACRRGAATAFGRGRVERGNSRHANGSQCPHA